MALSVLLPAMGEPTAAVYAGIDASALMRELGLPTPRILSCDLAGVHYRCLAPEAGGMTETVPTPVGVNRQRPLLAGA